MQIPSPPVIQSDSFPVTSNVQRTIESEGAQAENYAINGSPKDMQQVLAIIQTTVNNNHYAGLIDKVLSSSQDTINKFSEMLKQEEQATEAAHQEIASLRESLQAKEREATALRQELETHKQSLEAPLQAKKRQTNKIIEQMKSSDWDVRERAIHALSSLLDWPVGTEQNCAELFKDEVWRIQQQATLLLGPHFSPEGLVQHIAPLLDNSLWHVRQAAVRILGQYLSSEQLDLERCIALAKSDPTWKVRREAIYALGPHLVPERLVQEIMPLLKDEFWEIQFAAIYVLYLRISAERLEMRISAERLAQEVMWLEKDSCWEAREIFINILGKLDLLSSVPGAKEVLIRLAKNDSEESIRKAATSALNKHAISV